MPPSRTKATSRRARQWHLAGSKGWGEVWGWGGLVSSLFLFLLLLCFVLSAACGGDDVGSAGGAVGVPREVADGEEEGR